jgi:hypothetical protein
MTSKVRRKAALKAWRTRRAKKRKHVAAGKKAAEKRRHRRAGRKAYDARLAKEASQL